ncbi:MAG: hydantoinase B/oxoprolinase family protein, partial [Acidimicrobiia bacterium]
MRIDVALAERKVRSGASAAGAVDPVLLEVTRSFELSVNDEMSKTIINLSGSPLFVGASDYACACVTDTGELLNALSFQMPMAYTVSNTVKAARAVYGDDLAPGDMIFTNDSFVAGGLHPSDCVIVTPVFHEGELVMWVGTVGHVTDVGGSTVGSFSVGHTQCFGEAVRFTPIKVYEQGRFRADVLDAFLTNVRIPERTEADLRAMMGANWVARERMGEFVAKYGVDVVRTLHAAALGIGEEVFRERIAALPDGEYVGESYMEHDGVDDVLYTFRCTVRKAGDELTVDFTGSSPQAPAALNTVEVATRGAVIAALATMLAPDVPFTEGLFRPVEIVAPPGTVMHAVKPAPISAGSTSGTRFGADAMIEALNYALAAHPTASHRRNGPWSTWTYTLFSGHNADGKAWVFTEFWSGFGGASGLPFRDGHPAMGGLQYLDSRLPNIEEFELLNPVLVVERGFHLDSGGPGRFRGGAGMAGVLIPHRTDGLDMTSLQNRRTAPGFGVDGGHPGGGTCIGYLRGAAPAIRAAWARGEFPDLAALQDGMELPPTRVTGQRLAAEDAYYAHSTSGQGYGDPIDRDPEMVAADVVERWVSPARAHDVYGVVLDEQGAPDPVATDARRAEIRAERARLPLASATGAR